jgi:methyltransferase (TIGR00027 family)
MSLLGDNIPGCGLFTHLLCLLERWNFYLTGRLYQDQISQLSVTMMGVLDYIQLRTCWLDDCVDSFVRIHYGEKINVVFLGAGFDTRCYRMSSLIDNYKVYKYEVDTVGTQTVKLRKMAQAGIACGKTVYVSCNFEKEDWLSRLLDHGFDASLPSLFVWEGVTMYLDRDVVKGTLRKVAQCGPGSCIAFDYLDSRHILTPFMRKISVRGGEPFKFGMTGDKETSELIEECNKTPEKDQRCLSIWEELKHVELGKRYLPRRYDGQAIGYHIHFGGFVLAGTS